VITRIPVRKFDDRVLLTRLLGSLHDQGYSLKNIEWKLAMIAPLDRDLLKDCLAEISVEPQAHVIAVDATRERMERFVR
jgi:hypothetical protein